MATIKEEYTEQLAYTKSLLERGIPNPKYYQSRIRQLEADLKFFESDEPELMLKVEGVMETTCVFRDQSELQPWIDEVEWEVGMSYKVEFVWMTGQEYGELDFWE